MIYEAAGFSLREAAAQLNEFTGPHANEVST